MKEDEKSPFMESLKETHPNTLLIYCIRKSHYQHIRGWLEIHKIDFLAGKNMILIRFPHKFKKTKEFFGLLDYAEKQKQKYKVRIYLCDCIDFPLQSYFYKKEYYSS